MSNARPEDPLHTPLDGHLLIQASAGTGKTYALTTLVARLLVETEHTIDELLVVTFTNAATGELRDRLRRTLAATLAHLRADDAGAAKDGQAASLVARWRNVQIDEAHASARIARSLQDFDRANVTTIHSFCQRALTEFAFDGALPFGFELGGTDALEVAAAVRDFWRIHMADAQAPLLEIARDRNFTPAELATWTGRQLGSPESAVHGAPDVGADFGDRFGAAHERWQQATAATRDAWQDHGDAFMRELQQLRFRKGSVGKIRNSAQEARAVFEGNVGEALPLATAMYLAPLNLSGLLLRRPPQQLPDNALTKCLEELAAAARAVDELSASWLRYQRRLVLQETRARLSERAWRDRRLSFNDLLSELHRALTTDGGDLLAARIRQRYPRALIDEFQDTDRLQAHIFERIYPATNRDAGLMVVGDPKQSIYRFRGADVFAYIKATGTIEDKLHLDRNYRSTPGLVRAVNALFGRNKPFLLPEIEHEPVQAATDQTAALTLPEGADAASFQIRLLPRFEDGVPRKDEVADVAASFAADEIAELLGGGATLQGRPLVGADIAVLVRTTSQGQMMAQALRSVGVQCVEMDDTSVFKTPEATDLRRLLAALADESSFAASSRLRGALASDLFGLSLDDVVGLQDDDRNWTLWHERAAAWRRMWARSGVATLVRHLLFGAEIDCGRHLLASPAGLRRLTNVLHLADLLREAESRDRLAPSGLVEWFGRQDPDQRGDEATQLRLESDEDLVRIITMHRSKGLEFPIVFLPFAWYRMQPRTRRDEPSAEYHDRDADDFPTILDLDPTDDAKLAEAIEDQSDELRLFYVAVTRAQHRCVVTWSAARDAEYAPPAWLIHGGDLADEGPAEAYKSSARSVRNLFKDPAAWHTELTAWAGKHEDIAVHEVSNRAVEPPSQASSGQALRARQLGRELVRIRQMTSYSALAAQAGAATSASEHDEVEAADHDRSEESPGSAEETSKAAPRHTLDLGTDQPDLTPDDAADAFAFPRGPRAGDCLHAILEMQLDPERDPDEEIGRALRRWRIEEGWAPVAKRMVENARGAPLGERGHDFRLVDLARPIPEMEFRLPASGLDRSQLGDCLQAHGYPHPFSGHELPKVEGFLQGFIDLVAQHDGRWYVIDYKSNWLGEKLADYSPAALDAAMHHHGYHLQYLLYLTALHRMLGLRLPDYDYDRHMGGALYLFLRAMRPRLPGHGVFHDLPTRKCIEAIDACLAGASDAIG